MNTAPSPNTRRKTYKNPRSAKLNRFYSREDVMSLYDVSSNTVRNWQNTGLASIKADNVLFSGDDLNAFHKQRRSEAKSPCRYDEIYCMCCKSRHSLREALYEVSFPRRGRPEVIFACPETGGMARKYVGPRDILLLKELRETKSSPENRDYSASLVPAEIGDLAQTQSRAVTAENAQVIYNYQSQLKEARGLHEKTIDAALRHIRQFERHVGEIDFRKVTKDLIAGFKTLRSKGVADGEPTALSASTIVHSFGDLKAFFSWLSNQHGYRSIERDLAEYFNPPKRLTEIAHASTAKLVASPDQIRSVLNSMPRETIWQRRDRAVVAFLFLSGVRDGTAVSLRIKHIDIDNKKVHQIASEVNTKASKSMVTAWFPVGEDIEQIVIDWIHELLAEGAAGEDPLFPKTPQRHRQGDERAAFEFWATADPVRKILKSASTTANTPYFKPHSIRSTIARLFDQFAISLEEQKALSQNLGHENYRTTETYYGKLDESRQHELVAGIRDRQMNPVDMEIMARIRNAAPEKLKAFIIMLGE